MSSNPTSSSQAIVRQGTSPRPRPSPFLCVSPILRPLNTTIRHAVGEYTRGRHVGACATQFRFSVVPRMRSAERRRADFVFPPLKVPLPAERQTRCISGPMHQCRTNVTKKMFSRCSVPLPAPLACGVTYRYQHHLQAATSVPVSASRPSTCVTARRMIIVGVAVFP